MVVTVVTAAAVSVDRMGSSVCATLGRRPVVASGARLRRGNEDWLAGSVGPQRLAASEAAWGVAVERRRGGAVDDRRGLGGEHVVD